MPPCSNGSVWFVSNLSVLYMDHSGLQQRVWSVAFSACKNKPLVDFEKKNEREISSRYRRLNCPSLPKAQYLSSYL